MNFVNTSLVASGLSVDACAAALAFGLARGRGAWREALIVGATFGAMSGAMPLLGAVGGGMAAKWFERVDHWIAFAVLAGLGLKSLFESRRAAVAHGRELAGYASLFVAALATSIDTLAAGFSFELVGERVATLAWLTGAISACGSAACYLGANRLGPRYRRAGMVVGGIVLIAIAFNVLREHADHLSAAARTGGPDHDLAAADFVRSRARAGAELPHEEERARADVVPDVGGDRGFATTH